MVKIPISSARSGRRRSKGYASFNKDEIAQVSFTVKNTGSVVGDEVAQFYIRQDYTSLVRPVLELEGFKRMTLQPGESQYISFPIGYEQIKFWKDNKWTAEAGKINLMIGSSSEDIRLTSTVDYQAP